MTQANRWQDEYAISRTATISTAATFGAASGEIGPDLNKFGMYLTDHPDIDPGQAFIDKQKTAGISTRLGRKGASDTVVVEYRPGIRSPLVTFPFDVTPKQIALPLWLLCQENVTEAAGTPFAKVYKPATTAAYETYCSVLRKTGNPSKSQAIHGCVVSKIGFSTTEGEALGATVDFIGRTYGELNMSAIALAYPDSAPLLFQDCVVLLAGTTININGWTLDLSIDHKPKHHNAQTVVKFIAGMLTGSGTIDFPLSNATVGDSLQRDAFVAGTVQTLSLEWGTAGVEGHLKFEMNVRYSGAPISADDELVSALPYEIVWDAPKAIDEAIVITLSDAVDRGI